MTSSASIESSPFVSPTHSPSLSPTRARRLSSRRGSVSAADPWNQHAHLNSNPSRALSSRLTIVRVPPPEPVDDVTAGLTMGGRRHRRHGSNASIGSTSSGKDGVPGGRMSFAFSSFTPANPVPAPASSSAPGERSSSPSASPRLRPSSPHRYSGSIASQTKLSPEQLVDLARSSCNPRPAVPSPNLGVSNGSSGPPTPISPAVPMPVSFTPLPDSIYLPFIDRPQEVSQLLSQPPTSKLLALLQQTFPLSARAPLGSGSPSTLNGNGEDTRLTGARDSRQWTFADLEHWLKCVDRDVAEDQLWVRKMRACILARSELLWERLKGALGVPPELDLDEDDDEDAEASVDINIVDINDVNVGAGESSAAARMVVLDAALLDESALADSPLEGCHPYGDDREQHVQEYDGDDGAYVPEDAIDEISIEPVLASSVPPPAAPPPPAVELGSSLEEVREEDEEEGGVGNGDDGGSGAKMMNGRLGVEEQVHGLRICTSPIVIPVTSVRSPFFGASAPGNYASGAGAGSLGGGGGGTSAGGAAGGSNGGSVQASPTLSMRRMHLGDADGDSVYDVARERGPGHPLFPSSFANLALKPTLGANARSKSMAYPPPPAFGNVHAIRGSVHHSGSMNAGAGKTGRMVRPEWAQQFDPAKHEYAVTTASSVSGHECAADQR